MIVECTNCDTRFQLDDARVPLRGIRVRCSRCKEAFFLEHPDADKADAIDDVASQAARGRAPETTHDLPPGSSVGGSEPDEEDWEFNADLSGGGRDEGGRSGLGGRDERAFGRDGSELGADDEEDDGIPGLGVDDGFQDDDGDFSSGLDLAGGAAGAEVDEGLGVDDDAVAEALADLGSDERSTSAFGEAADFSAPTEDKAPAASSPASERDADEKDAAWPQLGASDDWGFFSDDSTEGAAVASMDASGPAIELAEDDPADRKAARRGARGRELGSELPERSDAFAMLRGVGHSVGWIVVCCLFGLGVARGVFHVATTAAPLPASVELGPFRATHVHGAWFETARSTRLYAVTGRLRNDSSEPRIPGSSLRVELVSPTGSPLEVPPASAGALVAESDLRELPADTLERLRTRSARRLAQTRLEPGEDVAFLAFFDGVPDAAQGFVLEMDEAPPPLTRERPPRAFVENAESAAETTDGGERQRDAAAVELPPGGEGAARPDEGSGSEVPSEPREGVTSPTSDDAPQLPPSLRLRR